MPGAGLLGADAAFPVLHGPFGEDGTRPGPAGDARRPLRRLRRPRLGGLHGQADPASACFAHHGIPQVDFVQAGDRRAGASARRRMGLPLWVKPSRLGSSVGITKVDVARADLDEAVELALAPRPAGDRRGVGAGREVECSVLGNEEPGDLAAGRDRRPRRLVRLRGQVLARGAWSCRAGPDRRRAGRARSGARGRGLRASPAAAAWRAATSSSSRTARSSSTRSTRCPASPRRASTRSSGRRAASPTRELCDRLVELAVERHAASALPTSSSQAALAGRGCTVGDLDLVAVVGRGRGW